MQFAASCPMYDGVDYQSKHRDDTGFNPMRTMTDAMRKVICIRNAIASVQLASQITHDFGRKFTNPLLMLQQLLECFVPVWVPRHSDISSEDLQDFM